MLRLLINLYLVRCPSKYVSIYGAKVQRQVLYEQCKPYIVADSPENLSSQLSISRRSWCWGVRCWLVLPQGGSLFRHRWDDWLVICHVIWGVSQLVAQVILINDVGGLRVQLPHVFFVEPPSEASHLGKLPACLQHHQYTHQAQQQIDWHGKRTYIHTYNENMMKQTVQTKAWSMSKRCVLPCQLDKLI